MIQVDTAASIQVQVANLKAARVTVVQVRHTGSFTSIKPLTVQVWVAPGHTTTPSRSAADVICNSIRYNIVYNIVQYVLVLQLLLQYVQYYNIQQYQTILNNTVLQYCKQYYKQYQTICSKIVHSIVVYCFVLFCIVILCVL